MTDSKGGALQRISARWWATPLWKRILVALLLGIVVGLIWGEDASRVKIVGDIFIRLIRMIVTPLVFLVIASGVASLGDPKRLGSIGVKTLALYFLTTGLGACIGLLIGGIVQPGAGVIFSGAVSSEVTMPRDASDLFLSIIPLNPVKSMADGEILAVIFFAMFVGAAVIVAGAAADPLKRGLAAGSEVMLRMVGFVMEVAPFGVFALVAVVIGNNGPETFISIFRLALCVLIGASVQVLLVHSSIVRLLAWLPVLPFFRGVADAMLIGFSTASSSATLPVVIRVAENNLGISKPVASTVLPLGVTLGMDGTAMYVGLLTMFAAQTFGVPLDIADIFLVVAAITVVAMGAGPVPSGSLFVLAAVLAVIGISAEQTALLVGFILPFDRLLDMTRTIPNVTADLAVATTVGRWEKEIDVDRFHTRPVE